MNHYETVFILTPVLSETQVEETVEKFTKMLTDQKAEIVNLENWGLKKLAYPIQLKRNGFYTLVEFQGNPELVAELELAFKRDERVLRYLTVKLDKYGVEWAEERKKRMKQSSKA